ncbi:MAG: FecR family protein [Candidatus Binatus sp.]|uniref:FecR family protein n=1 Tax=Candidatus Binatus sp. TaxID=2811406 RepID=UPI00271A518A|nr:FecR family protein [Candidatus Binatus sp.]MDO8430858.1 FecR family protein [Candidatus Binatus sp.]
MQIALAIAIAITAAIAPATVWAQPAQNVGTITQLTGSAGVQRGAATLPAAINTPVQLHDRITTQPNSSLTISMIDNSSLQLGAQATLTIDDSMLVSGAAAPSKVGLLGGSLHSLITGAMRGASPTFEVHTPNAVGAVRGTEFDTTYTEGTERPGYKDCRQFTDVAVQDGVVNVSNPLNPAAGSQDVHKGQKTTVACGAFATGGAGFSPGFAALGVAGAAGAGAGIAAGAGAFDGSSAGSGPGKPATSTK